jgi:hypothetical protein
MKDRCQGVSYGETAERCKKRKAGQGWGRRFHHGQTTTRAGAGHPVATQAHAPWRPLD